MLRRNGPAIHGVSPEAGRESMVGKICERGSSWAGSQWRTVSATPDLRLSSQPQLYDRQSPCAAAAPTGSRTRDLSTTSPMPNALPTIT